MGSSGGLIHWQAKLGMTMVGIGTIGLFLTTQSTLQTKEHSLCVDFIRFVGFIDVVFVSGC